MSNDGFHVSPHTLQILGWDSLLNHLARCASSTLGRDRCLENRWSSDPAVVGQALDETGEARELIETRSALSLEGVHDINPHIKRLEKDGTLSGVELLQIASTLRAGVDAQIALEAKADRFPLLAARTPDARGIDDLGSIIEDCIEPDGSVSDRASPELEALRAESLSISERISDRISGYLNSPDYAKALQDNFYTVKRDRFVLPIRADARGRIDGIVQDSSSSGATLFIEPREIVDLNNQLVIANLHVEAEQARILREISADLAAETVAIEAILFALVALDVIQARARMSIRLNAARPVIEPEGPFRLAGARHPLLALAADDVVPNDVSIGPGFNTLIITGPNTGGKTVTLKTLGLCALMVRAGLHIPASPDSIVPLFRRIFADIGDEQSVERNLSTFSGHIRQITSIVDEADDRSLVLLDELIVGTDPFEGASLAEAILEALSAMGASTVVTTHYNQLKELASAHAGFSNASVEFDVDAMRPTFRLNMGVPGRSSAIPTAKRLNLRPDIIDRAGELYGQGYREVDALLDEIQSLRRSLIRDRQALRDDREAIERARKEMAILKETYQRRLDRADNERDRIVAETRRGLEGLFAEGHEQVADVIRTLQRGGTGADAAKAREEILRIEQEAQEALAKSHVPKKKTDALDPEELTPGRPVTIREAGTSGVILAGPDRRGMVMVQVGGKRMKFSAERLGPASGKKPPKRRARGLITWEENAGEATEERSLRNACDLRGLESDDAVARTEALLDKLVRSDHKIAYVIHGHGTGALKKAVRLYLEESPYVENFRPGDRSEGGDGVTVVALRK